MSLESEINKHIINKLEQERDMYKRNWDKTLKERDTLIDDIAVLRANNKRLERENGQLKKEEKVNRTKASLLTEIEILKEKNERLRNNLEGAETYIDAIKTYYPMYEKLRKQYTALTNHIRLKAENNPNVDRYIALVNYIDKLERE